MEKGLKADQEKRLRADLEKPVKNTYLEERLKEFGGLGGLRENPYNQREDLDQKR